MNDANAATDFNRNAWDRVAAADDKWFRVCTPAEIESARNGELQIKLTPTKNLPNDWLAPLENKRVLCLAGGGGQQAPLLAAAGAIVTVFDLSEKQLQRDQLVAEREGLSLDRLIGDMRDLSMFADASFELIINPTSVCYCPDVLPIWRECFRVLNPGGHLIAGMINPNHYLFECAEARSRKTRRPTQDPLFRSATGRAGKSRVDRNRTTHRIWTFNLRFDRRTDCGWFLHFGFF